MLQQLQNLASNDIIHSHQNCPLVESLFFYLREQMLERESLAKSWVEDCLELNFRYVDYQTLAHLSYGSCVC